MLAKDRIIALEDVLVEGVPDVARLVGVIVDRRMALAIAVPGGEADPPAILDRDEMTVLLRLGGQNAGRPSKPQGRIYGRLQQRLRQSHSRWAAAPGGSDSRGRASIGGEGGVATTPATADWKGSVQQTDARPPGTARRFPLGSTIDADLTDCMPVGSASSMIQGGKLLAQSNIAEWLNYRNCEWRNLNDYAGLNARMPKHKVGKTGKQAASVPRSRLRDHKNLPHLEES